MGVARSYSTVNLGGGNGVGNIKRRLETVPLYNLVPSPGEPARLGFIVVGLPIYIDPSVRSGRDYGITVNVENITQLAGVLEAEVTVWGTPGASSHTQVRGEACLIADQAGHDCSEPSVIENPTAFLSLPTSCPVNRATGQPEGLLSTVTGDSWVDSNPASEQPQAGRIPDAATGRVRRAAVSPVDQRRPGWAAGEHPDGVERRDPRTPGRVADPWGALGRGGQGHHCDAP